MSARGLLCVALVSVACAEPLTPAVSALRVELGHGEVAYAPLADGDPIELYRGNQGYQHVFVSLRAEVDEGFHPVTVTLHDERGEIVSSPLSIAAPFRATDGPMAEVVGLLLVVPDPTTALEGPGSLRAEVEGGAGLGFDERSVRVVWGPGEG